MKKVGIFSGTFDPVHEGHISFAKEALKRCKLDKVYFLVEPRPRRKQGVKAFEHRTRMVELAVENESKFGSIILEQARFTARDTLPVLQARFKGAELYMLMGEDMLDHLASWPNVSELVDAVRIVIGVRKKSIADVERQLELLSEVSGLHFRYTVFRASNSEFTSTKIRLAQRRGQSPNGLDPKVAEYVQQEHLYTSKD